MFFRIILFASLASFFVSFVAPKERFSNCFVVATVWNNKFKPVHLPNIPRKNFDYFTKQNFAQFLIKLIFVIIAKPKQ